MKGLTDIVHCQTQVVHKGKPYKIWGSGEWHTRESLCGMQGCFHFQTAWKTDFNGLTHCFKCQVLIAAGKKK